jgi:hypothetical protein
MQPFCESVGLSGKCRARQVPAGTECRTDTSGYKDKQETSRLREYLPQYDRLETAEFFLPGRRIL